MPKDSHPVQRILLRLVYGFAISAVACVFSARLFSKGEVLTTIAWALLAGAAICATCLVICNVYASKAEVQDFTATQ